MYGEKYVKVEGACDLQEEAPAADVLMMHPTH